MADDLAHASTLDAIEPVPADPLIGRRLDGRYRIESRLGEGGMGIVYAAKHEVLGSRVALKILRSDASRDDEAIARLEREAQAASAIGSEHIVDVRDFGQLEDGSTFIVMELVEGRDLFSLIQDGPIEWRRARKIALQLCDALAAAHERGIVHRDLKLENILLTTRRGVADFVKVLDFGIAKVQGGAKITVAGRVMGTPEYMSPEQCAGGSVDHRTDVYSLGVVLYEMITGSLPFEDPDLAKLLRMQMTEKPVPPSQRVPDLDIPLGLEAAILRCLAKDPDSRFASMNELADALEELEAPAPEIAAREPRSAETVLAHPVESSGPRSRTAFVALAIVGIVGVGIALGWGFVRSDPPAVASAPARVTVAPRPEPEPVSTPAPPPAQIPAAPAPELTQAIPSEIRLDSVPSARVFSADGALLGETPLSLRRPEGPELVLELRANGYQPSRITLTDQSAEELRVMLARRAAPARREVEAPAQQAEPAPPPAQETAPPPRPDRPSRDQFLDPWNHD